MNDERQTTAPAPAGATTADAPDSRASSTAAPSSAAAIPRRRQPTLTTKHVTAQTDSSPTSSPCASARARSARFPVTRTNEGRGPTRTQPTGSVGAVDPVDIVEPAALGPPVCREPGSAAYAISPMGRGADCTWSRSWRLLCSADRSYEPPEVTKYWHQHQEGSPRTPKRSTASPNRRARSQEPKRTSWSS